MKRVLGAQWFSLALVSGVSLALSVAVARLLGPEAFGVYAQAVALGMLLMLVIDGGFGKLLMREHAGVSPALRADTARLHGYAYGHALLVVGLGIAVAALFPLPLHVPTLIATIAAFGVAALANLSMAILRGQGRLMRDAMAQTLSRLLTAAAVALAIIAGAYAPWELLAAQCAGGLLFLWLMSRGVWVRPLFGAPVRVYGAVLPLIALDVATAIYFRSDMLLFKWMGTDKADVGAYGVACRLIEAALMLATPISLLLFRRYRQSAVVNANEVVRQIFPMALMMGGVGLLVFIAALTAGGGFFSAVFGEGYALAGELFKVLSLMLVAALANGVLGQGVFALGLDRAYLIVVCVAAVFNVAGNVLAMPVYGVWAAAWLTVATEVVLGIGLFWIFFRHQRLNGANILQTEDIGQ